MGPRSSNQARWFLGDAKEARTRASLLGVGRPETPDFLKQVSPLVLRWSRRRVRANVFGSSVDADVEVVSSRFQPEGVMCVSPVSPSSPLTPARFLAEHMERQLRLKQSAAKRSNPALAACGWTAAP
jgi:hypothetical protein